MADDALDMSALEYVDPGAAGRLECPLCVSVLDDPVVVCRNEHHLCRACADEQRRVSDRCPTCRRRLDVREGQRFLRSSLDDLRVYCPNRSRGCDETLRREELRAHMALCAYSVVGCPHCDTKMERRLLSDGGVHWHCDAADFGCDFVAGSKSDAAAHSADCAVSKCRPQFERYERRIAALESAACPTGAMLAWAGPASALPASWALCDGEGGRPDRREEFEFELAEEERPRRRRGRRRHGSSSRSRSRSRSEGESRPVWYSLAYIIRAELPSAGSGARAGRARAGAHAGTPAGGPGGAPLR